MNVEVGFIFSVVACGIGVITFFLGQTVRAKNDGERWGRLESTLEHIQNDLTSIKQNVIKNYDESKRSIERIHDRLDNHLRHDHGMKIPKRTREDDEYERKN